MSMSAVAALRLRIHLRASLALFCAALAGCGAPAGAIGDASNGKLLLRQFGCGTCHRIPGVVAAEGTAGPPLQGVASRVYLAGVLPNSPANMASWIRAPQRHKPGTTMPDMGITAAQADDMVAFLQGLR
jgi:cytochrome c2